MNDALRYSRVWPQCNTARAGIRPPFSLLGCGRPATPWGAMRPLSLLLLLALGLAPGEAGAAPCTQKQVDLTHVFPNGGNRYVVDVKFGVLPDWGSPPTVATLHRSTARLFEHDNDTVMRELGPAHSVHTDIGSLGRGRFSHWGNESGSVEALFFSTSDNSDPRSNGRTYWYCTELDTPPPPPPTTTTVPPTTTTTTLPLCSMICRMPARPRAEPPTTTMPAPLAPEAP